MRKLYVYVNEHKAGVLTEQYPGKGYTFVYDESYLTSGQPAISVTLPKQKDAYESESLFPFFSNMLPEGANRKVICRASRIDETDYFGLLTVMAGSDFIGAVNLRATDND